jgi:hypothetical protein
MTEKSAEIEAGAGKDPLRLWHAKRWPGLPADGPQKVPRPHIAAGP